MAIFYKTAGAWGAGVGSRLLLPVEVDENFYDHDGRIGSLEDAFAASGSGKTIVSFDVVGDQFYVTFSDSSQLGPYQLPMTTWNFRGAWVADTAYTVGDIITAAGSVYMVIFDHTSVSVFDAGENDGMGNDYYGLLLSIPSSVIPVGGSTGFALVKASIDDYDVTWAGSVVPAGGTAGQVLAKVNSGDYFTTWVTPATQNPRGFTTATISTSTRTFAVGDEFKYFRCTSNTYTTLTVPTNSAQPIAVNTEITICARLTNSVATVNIVASSGVTLNIPVGFQAYLLGNGAVVTIKKVNTDEWDLFGLLLPL